MHPTDDFLTYVKPCRSLNALQLYTHSSADDSIKYALQNIEQTAVLSNLLR